MLDEVVVNLQPVEILGDTLRYRLSMFTDSTETNLKEALEKLPGFEISEQGEVSVHGKKVDKVLLDGDDFMNDQTKIALETLPGDAAKDVDYIKDYTESKTNRGMGSKKTALNIELRDAYKNQWKGEAKTGVGMDLKGLGVLDTYNLNKKFKVFYVGEIQNVGSAVEGMGDYRRALGTNGSRSSLSTTLNPDNSAYATDLGNIQSLKSDDVNKRESLVQTLNISTEPNDELKLAVSGVFSRSISNAFTRKKRRYFDRSHTGATEQHFRKDIDDDKDFLNTGFTATYTPSDDLELYCNFKFNGVGSFDHRLQTQEGVQSDQLNEIRSENYATNLEINDRFGEKSLGNIVFYATVGNHFSKYRLSSEDAIYLPEDQASSSIRQQKNTYTSAYAVTPGYTYRARETSWSLRSRFLYNDQTLRTQGILDDSRFLKPALQTQAIATEFAAEKNEGKIQYRLLPAITYRKWTYRQGDSSRRLGYFFEPLFEFDYQFRDFHYLGLTYKRTNDVYDLRDLYRGYLSDGLSEYKMGGLDLDYSTNDEVELHYIMVDQISQLQIFGLLTYDKRRNAPTVSAEFDTDTKTSVTTARIDSDSKSYRARLSAHKTIGTQIPLRISAGLNLGTRSNHTYIEGHISQIKNTDYGGHFGIETHRSGQINLGTEFSYRKNKNKRFGMSRISNFESCDIGGFIRGETLKNIRIKLRYNYDLSKSNDSRRTLDQLSGRIWYQKPKGKFRYSIKMKNVLHLGNPLRLTYKNTDFYQQESLSSTLPGYVLAEVKYRF